MLTQLSIPYPSTSLTAPPTDHIKFPIAAAAAKKPKTKKKLGQVRVHRHFKHKPKNISTLVHVFVRLDLYLISKRHMKTLKLSYPAWGNCKVGN
jgi:hypothetical protein